MNLFKALSPRLELEYRKWARANYVRWTDIKGVWHPAVQHECVVMNVEGSLDSVAPAILPDDASTKPTAGIKPGDIWYCTFGYDAHLVTWYAVTRITPTMIELTENEAIETGDHTAGTSRPMIPSCDIYGARSMHRVKRSPDGLKIRISRYSSASPWDGKSEIHTYNSH